jgi:hypothetical protein
MVGRKRLALLGALVLSVALAACGGSSSSGVSAADYVKSICQAVGPFEKDVQARSQAISNLGSGASAAQGKKALQDFLSAVVADTDQALNKLKAAGNPNVNNGKQIETAIVQAFTTLKTALQTANKSASALPTSSPEAFKTAAQQLGSTITSSMSSIGSSLNNLKSADLEAAAKKEPACQSIGA